MIFGAIILTTTAVVAVLGWMGMQSAYRRGYSDGRQAMLDFRPDLHIITREAREARKLAGTEGLGDRY